MKTITYVEDFRKKAEEAIGLIADIVKITLGPDGLPVLIEREKQTPFFTKDGVTVAESVSHSDPTINTIIEAIKESARKTGELAGDGTTSSIVLTEAIFREALKFIRSEMITPQELFREIEQAIPQVYERIQQKAISVETSEQRHHVAMISSNGDKSIADSVVEAIDNVGDEGYIGLEEGNSRETNLRFIEGLSLDRGYQHWGPTGKDFINVKESDEVIYENDLVALYNGTISSGMELYPLMTMVHGMVKQAMEEKKTVPSLFIVAHNIVGEAYNTLLANKLQAGFPVYAIKTPISGSPNSASLLLEDLAVLTGGKVLSSEDIGGISLPKVTLDCLGEVKKIVGKSRETILFEPQGRPEEIETRVKSLKKQVVEASNAFDSDNLKRRIGQLVSGICVIEVGGNTDLERKEKKDRVDDALCAVRAASEEGIVAGGGMTLHYIAEELWGKYVCKVSGYKMTIGEKVLSKALKYPSYQILQNGGKNPDQILIPIIDKGYPHGFNARLCSAVNLIESGVVDPAKVVKLSLQSAVSIASELLRGGGMITFTKEEKSRKANAEMFLG